MRDAFRPILSATLATVAAKLAFWRLIRHVAVEKIPKIVAFPLPCGSQW
jgi:hypothetical protein